jgi:hypothetical protein
VRHRLHHPVREQVTQAGPLESGCRIIGELLHEQHVRVLTAGQVDNHIGHSPAGEQIGRQDPQHGPRGGRLTIRYGATTHRGAQGSPGGRGHDRRARAGQQQRAGPGCGGYLRGERQQWHGPRFGEPQTISARQPGGSPAGQRAGHCPLHLS